MKHAKRVLLVIALIGIGLGGCTSEQLKSVGESVSNILPNLLADISTAYGGPYGSLVGQFFKLIVGRSDEPEQAENDEDQEGYSEYQGEEGSSGGSYAYEETDDDYPQSDEYAQQEYGEQEEYGEPYYADESQDQYAEESQAEYADEPAQKRYSQSSHALQVSIDVIKEQFRNGRYVAVPITDGDTLTQNDNYKVLFRSQTPCYMYIAQLDATGKLDPIFPSRFAQYRNPIQAGRLYDIPAGKNWFYLDANRGVETIYFIASRTPRQDIEGLFQKLEQRNRSLIQKAPMTVRQAYSVNRGIGGIRPGKNHTVRFQNGSQGQFSATLFKSIEADFVMTRWFNHQ